MDFERRHAAVPADRLCASARRRLLGAGAKLARALCRVLAGRIVGIAVEQRIAEADHGLSAALGRATRRSALSDETAGSTVSA